MASKQLARLVRSAARTLRSDATNASHARDPPAFLFRRTTTSCSSTVSLPSASLYSAPSLNPSCLRSLFSHTQSYAQRSFQQGCCPNSSVGMPICLSPLQQRSTFATAVKKIKIKAYSSYKKRFRALASGLFKRWRSGKRHNAHSKTRKQRRQLRRPSVAPPALATVMKKLNFLG